MNEAAPARGLRTSDYDYHLPAELVAQHPADRRDASRLLVIDRASGSLRDSHFHELAQMVPAGDVLCLNTTRVRHARLRATRPSGSPAEVLLIHPLSNGAWLAMGRPGSALRPGKQVMLAPGAAIETVAVRPDGEREVRFVGITAEDAIARFGLLPLPPYITRDADREDEDRYQTVYADREGSVAAPTAGLHFTPQLLDTLRAGGVTVAPLDLEVGPGTFKPVEEEDPHQHPMHEEQFEIPEATAKAVATARTSGKSVWAVGTTVVRALEAAALGESHATRLLIMPGHQFRSVDHLVTNFHLPRSTLLMLVAAFAGYDLIMRAYEHAVRQKYRFYSYGDAMVIV